MEPVMAANVHVILARDVANLGRVGDLVQVRPGYSRNFLVPQGLALPASPKRVAEFAHKKRLIEHQRSKLRAVSEQRAQQISQIAVTLLAKVGEQGKLFGSITSRDISRALEEQGHPIHHRDIRLDNPLRSVGLHLVDVRLEADVTTQIKVVVAPDETLEAPEAVDAPEAKAAAEAIDDEAEEA
jgi:large subunit ribosomal protein L9